MSKIKNFISKKIPLWVVGIMVFFLLLFSFFIGWAAFYVCTGGSRLGRAGDILIDVVKIPSTVKELFEDKKEDYACSTEQRFKGESGFKFNYASGERSDAPYLLLNRFDNDRRQSVAELIDLNTQEKIHRWAVDVDPVWKRSHFTSKFSDPQKDSPTSRFRNIHTFLFDDGSIIFQNHKSPLMRFDLSGNFVWVNDERMFHHSIELDHEGNIWIPSNIEPSTVAIGTNFHDDAITKVSPGGKILFSKSVTHILDENQLGYLVYGRGTGYNDPIHLNDIQPVLEDGDYWKQGDLFLSLRHQSMALLYRPSTNRIVWYSMSPWIHQHDIAILNDHEIGVFDNNAGTTNAHPPMIWEVNGNNRYITYDFKTNKFSNPFKEGFEKLDIRTITEGRGHRYPGGKLFVEETNYGRLVVFDERGTIDWQFINRAADGKVYWVNWSRLVPRELGDAIRKLAKH
jgi:hypothetical protein